MADDRPEQTIDRFAAALNAGDVDAALALYDPDATFASQPGAEVRGLPAIRAALEQFAALRPRLTGEITKVLRAGDVALVMNRWRLEGTQPDGTPVELGGHSADVLRRAGDRWLVLIDDPWGAA